MKTKICCRCGTEKPEEEFSFRDKSKETRRLECQTCMRKYSKEHYEKHKDVYKEYARRSRNKNKAAIRAFVNTYLLEHPCVDCGNTDIRVLEFDHQQDKKNAISRMITNLHNLESIKKEIAKCTVRCANCHRIRHYTDSGWTSKDI